MLNNVIPPIIEPLGRFWKQPDLADILIDDTHAVVSTADFIRLADYSCSLPSGVYSGKVWRGMHSETHEWQLFWYSDSRYERHCLINRRILLVA